MARELPVPGEVLAGKYRIMRPLGAGAWADVFLAEHADLHVRVAIKLLANWRQCEEKTMNRFLAEARAAARLKTVHVCRVLDVGRTEDGAPYTVLEYLEGTDLQRVIDRERAIDPSVAVDYVLQVCEGLAEAHAAGIIHRDLKPANLFLTAAEDGSPLVKILDFGISKQTAQPIDLKLTRSSDLLGTPYYMSPEQLRAPSEVDARSDIWSLGVMLCRMITGGMPFDGGSFADLCAAITRDPLPERVMSRMPSGLAELVRVALEKDPARRYVDVGQFAAVLSQWRSGEESSRVGRIGRVLSRGGGALATLDTWHDPNRSPPPEFSTVSELEATTPTPTPIAIAAAQSAAPPLRRRRWKAAAVAALAVLLGVGATAVVSAIGEDPEADAAREPAAERGSSAPAMPTASAAVGQVAPDAQAHAPAPAAADAGTRVIDAGATPPAAPDETSAKASTGRDRRSRPPRRTRRTPEKREPRPRRDVYDVRE